MARQYTQEEVSVFQEIESELRAQGLVVDGQVGTDNADIVTAFFTDPKIAVTAASIRAAVFGVLKNKLQWVAPVSAAETEYNALYNGLSQSQKDQFGAWWFLPSTKKTIQVENDEGFSNASKILAWMRGKTFTAAGFDLAVTNLAGSRGSLHWAAKREQASTGKPRHKSDGKGWFTKDNTNLTGSDAAAHRKAAVDPADAAAPVLKPEEQRWKEICSDKLRNGRQQSMVSLQETFDAAVSGKISWRKANDDMNAILKGAARGSQV
jgi:hypothetical protein